MGELSQHNLQKYIDAYGCRVFVETGTGKGEGLRHACTFPFDLLVSIEIIEELYVAVVGLLDHDKRVWPMKGKSVEILKELLPDYGYGKTGDKPILFWLDAHFPGADFQLGSYDDEHPRDVKLPLEAELKIIRNHHNSDKHVIIIDDLRLMEPGSYELGDLPDREKYGYHGIGFIEEMFSRSHKITRDLRHQGFLILEPKCSQS